MERMSQSPSSVETMGAASKTAAWDFDSLPNHKEYPPNHPRNWRLFDENEDEMEDETRLSEAWDTPNVVEMKRRLKMRQTIREETLLNRRIHRHGGIVGGRNIAHALIKRQLYGSGIGGGSLRLFQELTRGYQLPCNVLESDQQQEAEDAKEASTNFPTSPKTTATLTSSSTSTHRAVSVKTPTDRSRRSKSPRTTTRTPINGLKQDRRGAYYPTTRPTKPFGGTLTQEFRTFAEYASVTRYHSAFLNHLGAKDAVVGGQRTGSSPAVSTISLAFSPDGQSMASTHGDHTVKISHCKSGGLLATLQGHPRTPWTVKYHPIHSNIVASGCLGHQVRIWDWPTNQCLHMIRLEFAIISLSFHPQGQVLAIANGSRLHFWSMDGLLDNGVAANHDEGGSTTTADATTGQLPQRRGALTEIEQRHMLRCVHFPPDGRSIIVGGVNQPPPSATRRPQPPMSFYLRLFDFDVEVARRPHELSQRKDPITGKRRKIISQPNTFVPRALLYNDGGFDVSPDGKTICCCAEYWLPNGVDNAMDVLYPNDWSSDSDGEDDDDEDDVDDFKGDEEMPDAADEIPFNETAEGARSPSPTRQRSQSQQESAQEGSNDAPPLDRRYPLTPQTPPPTALLPPSALSPPSPPGRRFAGGLHPRISTGQDLPRSMTDRQALSAEMVSNTSGGASFLQPPPPPVNMQRRATAMISSSQQQQQQQPNIDPMTRILDATPGASGRFVPHVVTISLDTAGGRMDGSSTSSSPIGPESRRMRPRIGQLLGACPLDGAKASAVTCVKFSPSTDFLLIGYGVREPLVEHNGNQYHPVAALYRIRGGMAHVSTMLSSDDDVNIARFHPESGHGFVYGTKQGRVRVQSPRPWNFYNC